MTRKIVRLEPEHVQGLAGPCASCLFWERDPVSRERSDDPAADKAAWVAEVLREWGPCGQVALVEGEPVGYLMYAPEAFVPGARAFPTAPASADAVLLTTAYVDPAARGGLGRMLVQRMARDLVEREVRAVEAFGDTRGRAGGCLLPVDFLEAVGFRTQRAHSTTPRLRMDLRTAVTWQTGIERALARLGAVVRPAPKPVRAPEASRVQPVVRQRPRRAPGPAGIS